MFNEEQSDFLDLNILSGIARTVRDVVVREVIENSNEYVEMLEAEPPDPAIEALRAVVKSIKGGGSLQPEFNNIAALINNQESRAELIDTLILTHEYSRLLRYLGARKRIEDILLTCAETGKLTATEALAFLSLMNTEIKQMQIRVKSATSAGKDIFNLLSKVDFAMQQDEEVLAKKFANTSPQAREIARRLTHKLTKITKT